MNPQAKNAFDAWLHRPLCNGKTLFATLTNVQSMTAENLWADAWDAAITAQAAEIAALTKQVSDYKSLTASQDIRANTVRLLRAEMQRVQGDLTAEKQQTQC